MGFFDKLKQAANFVTGGGASVQVVPLQAEYDKSAPIRVRISAQIKDAPLDAKSIYLQVRSREQVNVKKTINGKTEDINEEHTGYTHKVEVAASQVLEGSKSYDWEVEFTLPTNAQSSFQGNLSKHAWEVLGGLDVKGNDPDSGWQEIRIK